MHPFPHHYQVNVSAAPEGAVSLTSPGLAALPSDAPAEFDGPGDRWSPEALLTAAVADCFVLSFRAVAKASKLAWTSLECQATGVLERIDGVSQFTKFNIQATLQIAVDGDVGRAERLMHKAEQICLITNSLKSEHYLQASVKAG